MMGTPSFLPGETFAGKYRVEKVLGEGGMGVVVAARHIQLDERVAIKFMRPETLRDASAVERFMREARASAKVKSEHIARVFDVGTESGVLYIVMEHLEGMTLASLLTSEGPLPVHLVAEYVLQACEAIAEAHARGIVHRDIKPENLFLTHRANGSPCVKVLDFGISKVESPAAEQRMTNTSALMGSPIYMSPEQLVSPRDVDARSDIWSLGVVLYELLSGAHPFTAESLPQLCVRIREMPAASLVAIAPTVPSPFVAIVMRCLEKDPGRRFASVNELASELIPFAPDPRASARTAAFAGGRATAFDSNPSFPARESRPSLPESAPNAPAPQTGLTWSGADATPRRITTPLIVGFTLLALVGVGLASLALHRRSTPSTIAVTAVAPPSREVASAPAVGEPTSASTPPTLSTEAPAEPTPVAAVSTKRPEGRRPAHPAASVAPGLAPQATAGLPAPPDDRK